MVSRSCSFPGSKSLILVWLFSILVTSVGWADVTGLEVTSRQVIAEGREFGDVGKYEEIVGKAYFEIDPTLERNRVIDGLELAPRSVSGKVTFSADVVILSPVEPARGSDIAFIDIANRGRKVALRFGTPNDADPYGDGFFMHQGFTLVWVGWEFDAPDRPDAIRIDVPNTNDARELPIGGLGFAAVRDLTSWIKYSSESLVSTSHAMAFGASQSGRFLRSYLYLGFNGDEHGRQVFDGVMPHIAGASQLDLNRLGAEPISLGMFTATSYPFADKAIPDTETTNSDGILDNRRSKANQPRIIYTNSSVEYWGGGRVAALTHTAPDGSEDIKLPSDVRSYHFASTQHVPATFPLENPRKLVNLPNPVNYVWTMRALFVAMADWIKRDVEPPPSVVPMLGNETLVAASQVEFPVVHGVPTLLGVDAGVRAENMFLEDGGGAGQPLPLLVPNVDADGNEFAGIRQPEVVVPLATYTGWNFSVEDQKKLTPLAGSYIPFAISREQRLQRNDMRRSVQERYSSKDEYMSLIESASVELVRRRFLLESDIYAVLEHASTHWDFVTESAQ